MAESRPETRSGSEDEKTTLRHEVEQANNTSDANSGVVEKSDTKPVEPQQVPKPKKGGGFFSRKKDKVAADGDDEKKEVVDTNNVPPVEQVRDAINFLELFR